MKTDETNPEDFQNIQITDHSYIKGWGIDANRENDPTYPMKNRNNGEHLGYSWERPELQDPDVEILKSVERPNLTAVFGTAAAPSGISGNIRRQAFKFSESSYGRWLPLILADRVDMLEGIADDIRHGKIPNIFEELGLKAEWKYNRKFFILKTAAIGLATAAIITVLASNNKRKSKY
jgi:hypothetical protein